MPKYKNSFKTSSYVQETVLDEHGKKLGTVRVKPVSVAWKPANQREFFTVPLATFTKWITSSKAATKTKS